MPHRGARETLIPNPFHPLGRIEFQIEISPVISSILLQFFRFGGGFLNGRSCFSDDDEELDKITYGDDSLESLRSLYSNHTKKVYIRQWLPIRLSEL